MKVSLYPLVNHTERNITVEKIDGIFSFPLDYHTLLNPGMVVPQDGPEPLPDNQPKLTSTILKFTTSSLTGSQ